MDTTTSTTREDYIAEAFAAVPAEVQDFMASEGFSIIITAIQKALSLSDQQTDLIQYGAQTVLLQLKNLKDLESEWRGQGMSDELIKKALYLIDTEILTRAQNISIFYSPDPNEPEEVPKVSDLSNNTLATLGNRLSQSSVIAPPTKRDYSLDKSTTPPTQPRAADSYREKVDL